MGVLLGTPREKGTPSLDADVVHVRHCTKTRDGRQRRCRLRQVDIGYGADEVDNPESDYHSLAPQRNV